jgi:23S rRNA pseudouridine955/2504/2580 synthase
MPRPLVAVQKHLRIGVPWAGTTVFDAVRRAFPEVSPREVWRLARSGEIRRDGDRCHPQERLAAGQVLSVTLQRPAAPTRSIATREQAPAGTDAGPFWIVREDAELLAVSKPSGCASHPAARHHGDTLLDRVRAYLGVEPGHSFQPALANRLDIETSGLVLIAKTRGAQSRLGRNLQKGKLRKGYLTLVGGWPQPPSGDVEVPLERRPDSRDLARHGAEHPRCQGRVQAAHTRYRTRERLGRVLQSALLEVEILTGRTHQIRRHLTLLGHPLAGDRRYGDPGFNRAMREVAGLQRMFLHAAQMELQHPATGEPLRLEAPLPPELRAALAALGCHVDRAHPLDAPAAAE